jgi:F-type H+-transporting ATPase subunit delta
MTDRTTIARPYARAAFADARERGRLAEWDEALGVAARVLAEPRVQKLLGSPHVAPKELAALVSDVAKRHLDEHGHNFIRTLADNGRLGLLPEIAQLFSGLKDAEEGIVNVTVVSAAPLDAEQKQTLAKALARRLNREVRLTSEIDPTLLGGAVLRAGDLVIDGSLRARLERMAWQLTA